MQLSDFKRIYWDCRDLARYCSPNLVSPTVQVSKRAQAWVTAFRENGVVMIEGEEFAEAADYINRLYFRRYEEENRREATAEELGIAGAFVKEISKDQYKLYGTEYTAEVSFKDPGLGALLTNVDLVGLYYNYFRRQPYYRNQPIIQKISHSAQMPAEKGNAFHVDHLHQVSCMLLLNDITENDTHMDYAVGTHRRPVLKSGISISDAQAKAIAQAAPLFPLVGKKGTLFVFDAHGVHRRNLKAGGSRKMFHCNITTGHHIGSFTDALGGWNEFQLFPKFVQKAFRFLPKI